MKVYKSEQRGLTKTNWLNSRHSFSFGHYYNPDLMGFSVLRVINEDYVMPGSGFASHPHKDMEILTYVLEGELEHKDSLNNGSIIKPGELQQMSAGTGIIHSEFNAHNDKHVHLLQIWILPEKNDLPPSYEQKSFLGKRRPGSLTLLASSNGREESITVHQDVNLYGLDLDIHQSFTYKGNPNRVVWVQIAKGSVSLNQESLTQGDAVAIEKMEELIFHALESADILIFDLPKLAKAKL